MLRIARLLHASATSQTSSVKFALRAYNHPRRTLHSTKDEHELRGGLDLTLEREFDAYSDAASSVEPHSSGYKPPPPPVTELAVVLPRAHELGASNVVRDIASRYLLLPERNYALGYALLESYRSMSLLSRSQVVAVFKKLAIDQHNLEYLSTNVLIYIGHICILDPASNFSAVESILFTLLERWTQDQGVGHEQHFQGTWAIFQLLRTVMKIAPENGQRQFRTMLQSRPRWPEGAIEIDGTVKEPLTIVSIFMLRCCIAWRWWERAYAVAHELVQSLSTNSTVAYPIHGVSTNLITSHMEATGLLVETQLCAALICAISDEPSMPPLGNALLQRFYRACADSAPPRPETANAVYLYLRDKQFSGKPSNVEGGKHPKEPHSYHPPQGRRILSLLDLYHRTNDHNAARLLISDVQKRLDTIPNDILAPYLIFLIKLSFATEARAVYSMCIASNDPDKGAITLLPSVSRHMVTFFVSMADASRRRSLLKPKRRKYHDQQAQELMQFARSVARRYQRSVLPFDKWEHKRLTTLARICFDLGKFEAGFEALKIIARRTDLLPDAHDMSIVLHLLASVNPQSAANLLDYMISRGIEPDSSAYGIVTSQCLKHGNIKLAGDVLAMAKKRGRGEMNSKLLGAICWHSISVEGLKGISREETTLRLETVLGHLGPSDGIRESVFRERTLGVRAANVALDIQRPDLALKFWRRCIRFKTIVRQPNEEKVGLERDQERLLRERILKRSKESGVVTWNLPQGVAEALATAPRPKSIKREHKAIDEKGLGLWS